MEAYGQEKPPLIDLADIKEVPIAMYVGKKDSVINIKDNRLLKEQLNTVVSYNEYDLDHLSFLLAKNMSFFDNVIE